MDGVKEAKAAFEPVYKQWLATEAAQMFSSAQTLGIIEEIPPQLRRTVASGTTQVSAGRAAGARTTQTRRRVRRTTGGGNGSTGRGRTVTGEQVLSFLQDSGGATQAQIARHFGVSDTSAGRYIKRLGHQVEADGSTWRARALTPA